mgnify:CR=1 FL=1
MNVISLVRFGTKIVITVISNPETEDNYIEVLTLGPHSGLQRSSLYEESKLQ